MEWVIRPMRREELSRIAELKITYLRFIYRGFIEAESLKGLRTEDYLDDLRSWVSAGYQVNVLELEGRWQGYVIYGEDPEDPGVGLIRDVAIDPGCDIQYHDALLRHAMTSLAGYGYHVVHLWTLRDNFRSRFLLEELGFHDDGARRLAHHNGQDMSMSRYVYRVSGWDTDNM